MPPSYGFVLIPEHTEVPLHTCAQHAGIQYARRARRRCLRGSARYLAI
ncbi:MAG: hypothetical protein AAGI45_17340 [Cyanobacteria bacterium P01_H01_bin.26]